MLCALLGFYRSELAPRRAQKLFSRGLRGLDLVEASRLGKITRSLNPLAGFWFMVGLVLMIAFVATNLTHENSGTVSDRELPMLSHPPSQPTAPSLPTEATNTTVP